MKKVIKFPKSRSVVNIDDSQRLVLRKKAETNYITVTHLVRILITMYLKGEIDISKYVPSI